MGAGKLDSPRILFEIVVIKGRWSLFRLKREMKNPNSSEIVPNVTILTEETTKTTV